MRHGNTQNDAYCSSGYPTASVASVARCSVCVILKHTLLTINPITDVGSAGPFAVRYKVGNTSWERPALFHAVLIIQPVSHGPVAQRGKLLLRFHGWPWRRYYRIVHLLRLSRSYFRPCSSVLKYSSQYDPRKIQLT